MGGRKGGTGWRRTRSGTRRREAMECDRPTLSRRIPINTNTPLSRTAGMVYVFRTSSYVHKLRWRQSTLRKARGCRLNAFCRAASGGAEAFASP
eukprot:5544589-Pleurochrysis_carterae.AAC.1